MTAIIIAAHNEEPVIGRCLDTIQRAAGAEEFEVIVAANGCTDDTVAQAEKRKVRVIDLPDSGKAQALNAADAVATRFPRLYLDADMSLSAADVRTLSESLHNGSGLLACAPKRKLEFTNRPLLVRAYFRIQQRLPVYESSLIGRGAVMISETGRARFIDFPNETADDLFLDALYTPDERTIVDAITTTIETPYTTKDLFRRLVRVRRGNIHLRQAELTKSLAGDLTPQVRASDRWSWLRDVVLPQPRLAPAGLVYAVLTLIAESRARRSIDQQAWERDESTRSRSRG
jgi:glycosyltransferase involved in cell wall biosynthesis